MNNDRTVIRVGILVLALAMALRIVASGALGDRVSLFSQPRLASFLVRTGTGRDPVQTDPPQTDPQTTDPVQTTQPSPPFSGSTTPSSEPPEPVVRPVFTSEDLKNVSLYNQGSLDPDMEALLLRQLRWDLTADQPTVLIVHTHATEAYTPTTDTAYEEYGGEYRTQDQRYNMLSIGEELARLLERQGIRVIHDRTLHDLNDYNNAYKNSRETVEKYLQQYPSIQLVLDIHRDAAEYDDGTQWATSATIDGERSAQLMMVVGGRNEGYLDNMSLAAQMTAMIGRTCAGVQRPINLRYSGYNQDLLSGSLIVEVGSAGNTHQEAMNCLPVLAEAIGAMAIGVN